MVRLVLVAALASALGACYEPQFADCVDTCGTSGICPEGLSCQNGFCRTEGATGSCENGSNNPVDAPMPIDGPPSGTCPPVPMMQGCMPVGPQPVMPYCHVTCSPPKTGTDALAFRVGSWHAAVISDVTELNAAMSTTANQPAWIGLRQMPSQGAPTAGWSWVNSTPLTYNAWAPMQPDDGNMAEDDAEQCAVLAMSKWADEPCTMMRPYVIEPF